MLEAQKQQHLRTLRRALNRAVTSFKEDGKVVCSLGWGFGRLFHHPWIDQKGQGESLLPQGDDLFLLLPPEAEQWEDFLHLIPEGARKAVLFFLAGACSSAYSGRRRGGGRQKTSSSNTVFTVVASM